MKTSLLYLALLLTASAPAIAGAADTSSLARGEQLFTDARLGNSPNGASCSSCHAGGAKLAHADENPDLAGQINRCIAGPLQGNKLDPDSADLKSLVSYVKSLSGGNGKR